MLASVLQPLAQTGPVDSSEAASLRVVDAWRALPSPACKGCSLPEERLQARAKSTRERKDAASAQGSEATDIVP